MDLIWISILYHPWALSVLLPNGICIHLLNTSEFILHLWCIDAKAIYAKHMISISEMPSLYPDKKLQRKNVKRPALDFSSSLTFVQITGRNERFDLTATRCISKVKINVNNILYSLICLIFIFLHSSLVKYVWFSLLKTTPKNYIKNLPLIQQFFINVSKLKLNQIRQYKNNLHNWFIRYSKFYI